MPTPPAPRNAPAAAAPPAADVPAADRARGLLRVVPFLRPHRAALAWSVGFAVLVAAFWGANLGLVLPVVNVLAEDGSVHGYVDREAAAAHAELDEWNVKLNNASTEVARLETDPAAGRTETIEAVESVAKAQTRIATAGRKLMILEAVQQYVVPVLPADKFDLLAGLLGVLLIATILKGLCVIAQDVLVGAVIERTVADLREELFAHTLKLDLQTLGASETGDLMSRFTNDLQQLANGLRLMGGKVVREPLKAVACVIGASFVSWQLTLMGFILAPLAAVIFAKIGRSLKRASRRSMESMGRLYKTMEETYEGAAVVTAFNAAGRQRDRFRTENRGYLTKAMKIVRVDALTSPTTETLGMLAAFGALLPGAYLVLRRTDSVFGVRLCSGQLDLAELAVLYSFLAGTIDPLRKLSSIFAKLKRSTAAADRLFEILDRDPAVAAPADPTPVPVRVREVAFSKVGFRYAGADRGDVLDGVTLAVPAGEVVAVVGENGSGKSTLLKLLPRFFDPTHGAVTVNGTDLRDFDPAAWRARVGVVTQETKLFDESIAENIRLGDPSASDEEVRRAAEAARVTDFSDDLPGGLEMVVGSKGSKLSGGQRQRVALARAVLRDPDVLILDEATSAVDALSEKLIHDALREFAKGRTVFLVTHSVRASLLDVVTRVAVMDGGALVADGGHDELLRTCPAYRRLYAAQIDGADFADANRPAPVPPGPGDPPHADATPFDPDAIDLYDPADHPAPRDEGDEELAAGHILSLPRGTAGGATGRAAG